MSLSNSNKRVQHIKRKAMFYRRTITTRRDDDFVIGWKNTNSIFRNFRIWSYTILNRISSFCEYTTVWSYVCNALRFYRYCNLSILIDVNKYRNSMPFLIFVFGLVISWMFPFYLKFFLSMQQQVKVKDKMLCHFKETAMWIISHRHRIC